MPSSSVASSPVVEREVPLLPRHSHSELSPNALRWLGAGVLACHALGAWALLQVDAVRQALVEAAPVMVHLIPPPAPAKPPAPPPPPKLRAAPPPPVIAAPAPPQAALPSFVVPETPPQPSAAPAPVQAPPDPAPAPLPSPPAPPAIREIPPSAIRYLQMPRLHMPRMAVRLGEQGTVWLRIVVDAQGRLKQASVRRSSGHARLDEQALLDIRSARFVPYLENGQAVEWETTAPLAYEIEN